MRFLTRKDRIRREGRIVTLPTTGRAIVCSDLHGHWLDYRTVLQHSRFRERITDGEEVFLILTGDVPDTTRHRRSDPEVPIDGDVRILDDLVKLFSEVGNRLIYLEGNHDYHLLRLVNELQLYKKRRFPNVQLYIEGEMNPTIVAEFLEEDLKWHGETIFNNNTRPYDMIRRVKSSHLKFLDEVPLVALLPTASVLVTHAGPVRANRYSSLKDLVRQINGQDRGTLFNAYANEMSNSPYTQLLNNRFCNADYDLADVSSFLKAFKCSTMITGHTPYEYVLPSNGGESLKDCKVENNLGIIGDRQVVLCTSCGAFSKDTKVYLELDLARPIPNVAALRPGSEVISLYCSE